jgi:DNA-binding CsgD family transcriptional regulator
VSGWAACWGRRGGVVFGVLSVCRAMISSCLESVTGMRRGQDGHRDLIAAASIAARAPGGGTIPALPQGAGITHRRAGAHLAPPPSPGGGTRGVARGNSEEHASPRHPVKDLRVGALVQSGDALLAPSITRRLIERFAPRQADRPAVHADLSDLTPRELEVLGLVGRGMSNAELAAHLTLSEATVKTHVARIISKLGLRDRIQAVVLAYETGLVGPARPQQ